MLSHVGSSVRNNTAIYTVQSHIERNDDEPSHCQPSHFFGLLLLNIYLMNISLQVEFMVRIHQVQTSRVGKIPRLFACFF